MGSIVCTEKTYTKNARWPSLLVAQPSSLLQADKMTPLPVSDDLFGLNLV